MLSFSVQDLNYDIHDLRNEPWEPLENFLDYTGCNVLKLSIGVLQKLQCWISELLELWINQINEDID